MASDRAPAARAAHPRPLAGQPRLPLPARAVLRSVLTALLVLVGPATAPLVAQDPPDTPGVNLQIEGDLISLSVNENAGLPILEFIKLAERITARKFTYNPQDVNQQGTEITWIGTVQLRRDEFFGFFQTMLYIKQFAVVARGEDNTEIIELVNLNGPRRAEVGASARYVPYEQLEEFKNRTGEQILTSIPLKYLNAPTATNALRPFFASGSPNGNVIPGNVGDNRALILQGYAPQIYGLSQLLKIMDVAPEEVDIVTRVIPVEYATAEELEPAIDKMLVQRQRRVQPNAGASGANVAATQGIELTVSAYPALNALLLSGTEEQVVEARELIAQLDRPYETSGGGMHVIELQNVLADELRETLNQFITEDLQAERQQQQGTQGVARQPRKTVVVAHPESNRLLISATQNNFRQLRDIIKQLDQRQPQVLIECALVELTSTDLTRFGIELAGVDLANGDFTRPFGLTSFGISTFTDTDGDGFPDTRLPDFENPLQGVTGGIISSDDFAIPVLVNALDSDSDANILSVPSVVVNNNEEATVLTQENRPTQNVTQGTATTQGGFGGFQGAGIELAISPTISSGNFLRLNLSLNVSRFITPFDPDSVTPGVKVDRQVTTQVTMPSGDTMVLGGVLEDTTTETDVGVPILKDIPLLGWLFRNYVKDKNKTNLYFFVTPTILDEDDFSDLYEVSYRKKLEASGFIGDRRLRIVDRKWTGGADQTLADRSATLDDIDRLGGFDIIDYDSRRGLNDERISTPPGGRLPTGPTDPEGGAMQRDGMQTPPDGGGRSSSGGN